MTKYILFSLIAIVFSSCIEMPHKFEKIPPGKWRGELYFKTPKELIHKTKKLLTQKKDNAGKMDEIPLGIIPFEFDVIYKENSEDFYIEIINGKERIRLDDISYGFDKRVARDTMLIKFPIYQTYIKAAYENGVLEGDWHVPYRTKYKLRFRANFGKNDRFNNLRKKPITDISGNWKTTFKPGTDDQYMALGEFRQNGNQLSATFATETGDYRFLEGTIQANKIYLSTFDGSHAFLFTGTILEDGSIEGLFNSGMHYEANWIATKDPNFQLRNANELTYVIDSTQKIDFIFPNQDGTLIDLNDPKYDNKVKLLTLMGTWCPNCMDETKFLVEYIKTHNTKDLVVFALAYERSKDINKVNKLLKKFKTKYNVPYEVLYAGPLSKKKTSAQFPMLNGISSYPTMIYLDKSNEIRKIHTGFYGPATNEYKKHTEEFDQFIQTLLSE